MRRSGGQAATEAALVAALLAVLGLAALAAVRAHPLPAQAAARPAAAQAPVGVVPEGAHFSKELRTPAIMRLLQAERSEEIYPLLIEEIVKLGYPRASVLTADFDGRVALVEGPK